MSIAPVLIIFGDGYNDKNYNVNIMSTLILIYLHLKYNNMVFERAILRLINQDQALLSDLTYLI